MPADIWVESKPKECKEVKDTTRSEGHAMIRIMRDIGIKSCCVKKLINIRWAKVIKRPNKVARIWSHLTCMQELSTCESPKRGSHTSTSGGSGERDH